MAIVGDKMSADMVVVLRKLGSRAGASVSGKLERPLSEGTSVVLSFPDGRHEYVTTPVKRVFRIAGSNVIYFQTRNSTYRMERQRASEETESVQRAGG